MKKLLLFLLVLLPLVGEGQIITTVAGTGILGHIGDGGYADTAELFWPFSLAFDKNGNYYIGEEVDSKIRIVSTLGVINTYCGTGVSGYNGDNIPAISAELNGPFGITVDTLGNLIIADTYNNRIRKVDIATGIITTIAGVGIAGFSGDGRLADSAELNGPYDVCFDRKGNLYISDYGNYRIRKINTSGIISTIAGNGSPGYYGNGVPAIIAEMEGIIGLCTDTIGNLYLADRTNGRVRKVDTSGIITTIAGDGLGYSTGDGGPDTLAQIAPERLAFDDSGNLYIACSYKYSVRKINAMGIIYTIAGIDTTDGYSGDGGPAINAQFDAPCGIAFDGCGNLFIADDKNARIRKVTFDTSCSLTNLGVKKVATLATEVTVYPNPATSSITITAAAHIKNVSICDLVGREVETPPLPIAIGTPKGREVEIDISRLPAGVYLVKVTTETGAVVRKLVKELSK